MYQICWNMTNHVLNIIEQNTNSLDISTWHKRFHDQRQTGPIGAHSLVVV